MTRYISILRGINVSGKNLIKMADLRLTFEKMGFQQVSSYVQSGNIIFSGKKMQEEEIEQTIFQYLKTGFEFDIPIIVLRKKTLQNIIDSNPMTNHPKKDPSFMHVTFLKTLPGNFNPEEIEAKKLEGEEFYFTEKAIYLYCPNGYGTTKLNNNFFEKKLQVTATTRNWRTTNKLLEIAINPVDGI